MLNAIATCMQNFKKIDRQKNQAFFIWKFAALFLMHPVQVLRFDLTNGAASASVTMTPAGIVA